MPKHINLDRKWAKSPKEPDEEIRELNTMLAYGSTNLGLNRVKEENASEKRVREDLGK
ncbi:MULTISPECIES: hypothetical protein [Clostridium]|uniref:hypothetical protein n=1 Tax=Clostridium TaxID=1485 RepID=UPI0012FE1A15|nr:MULTISPECIES: hypothetical protein [Clostridium]